MANKTNQSPERKIVEKAVDFKFVDSIIRDIVKDHLTDIASIQKLRHVAHKRRIGKKHSTFIYSYFITGLDAQDRPIQRHLIYSSHTDNSRIIAYNNMKLLHEIGFNKGEFQIIKPITYKADIKALIYLAVDGKNLLEYMRAGTPPSELHNLLIRASQWISKFHTYKITNQILDKFPVFIAHDINPTADELITTVEKVSTEQAETLRSFFDAFGKLEATLSSSYTPGLVYGDYHPENIITSDLHGTSLTMIDFTDVTRGDQLRDIGSFIQQLHFMAQGLYPDRDIEALRILFVENYFEKSLDALSVNQFQRINLYQAWNSLRGFTWLFFISPEPVESYGLLEDALLYLDLAQKKVKTISIDYEL